MVQEIEIPWSDGNQCHWPQESGPHGQVSVGHYLRADLAHDASIQWRTKLGKELAETIRMSPSSETKYILKDWPDGYALFVHHKGTRRDKYLYGLSEGKHFRSAAEFLPHAKWLMKGDTEPATVCTCKFCSKPRANGSHTALLQTRLPRLSSSQISKELPDATSEDATPGSPPSLSGHSMGDDRGTKTFSQPPAKGGLRRSERLVNRTFDPLPPTPRVTAYYFRASSGTSKQSHDQSPPELWPVLHELTWCKLEQPIESSGAAIEFWPGIIKRSEERSMGIIFHISLLGNKYDIPFTVNSLLPYQAHRMDGTLVQELRRRATGCRRIALVNLEKAIRTKLDDAKFSTISSTFVFALEFCQQLSTFWSCTPQPHRREVSGLQTPRNSKKEYKNLWWGPECIQAQQVVRLKVSLSSIHLDRKVLNDKPPQAEGSGRQTLVFMKVHSIFSESSQVRNNAPTAAPFVSGVLFGLVPVSDEEGGRHNLPPPPKDYVFFPLLKSGFEVAVPVWFISGRYYPDVPGKGAIQVSSLNEARLMALSGLMGSADSVASPTVHKSSRAKMIEHAYKEGKEQAQKFIFDVGTQLQQ